MLFAPPGFARYDYNNFLQESKSALPQLRLIILADIFRKHKLSSKSLEHQDYEEFLESKASSSWKEDTSISPHDMVNVQFTSGSTGLPKSVSLSHYNIMNCGRHIWLQTRLTSEDRICCPVPLFHSFGMIVGKFDFSSLLPEFHLGLVLTNDFSDQHKHRGRFFTCVPFRAFRSQRDTQVHRAVQVHCAVRCEHHVHYRDERQGLCEDQQNIFEVCI